MCRYVFYHGPAIRIAALVTEPDHSLIRQSVESRERSDAMNGDGFGVAWYAPALGDRPGRFRSITPAWNNENLIELARVVESPCILAHVRASSKPFAVSEANCHPFTHGPLSLMHNGDLGGFDGLRRRLLARLSDTAFAAIAARPTRSTSSPWRSTRSRARRTTPPGPTEACSLGRSVGPWAKPSPCRGPGATRHRR